MDDKESQRSNTEGTANQIALGSKARPKHIFSPLDAQYADAVRADAADVEFTDDEDVCALVVPCFALNLASTRSGARSTLESFRWC